MTVAGEKRADCGGITLSYIESGRVDAPALVFVHAMYMSAADWAAVIPAFESDYRVLAINLRGHASSDWSPPYSFEVMGEDLRRFLDALEIERARIVGHSLGGIASYFLAARHPERVFKLVLEEGPPPQAPDIPFDFGPLPRRNSKWDVEAVKSIVGQISHPDPGWWTMAGSITAPTLVISGGASSHVPVEWNSELARQIPDGSYLLLSGGHFVHSTNPAEFVEAVRDFLA